MVLVIVFQNYCRNPDRNNYKLSIKTIILMAHSRQPRQHASLADEVRQAIAYATASEAIRLIENGAIDVLDGEFRTPLFHAAIAGKVDVLS